MRISQQIVTLTLTAMLFGLFMSGCSAPPPSPPSSTAPAPAPTLTPTPSVTPPQQPEDILKTTTDFPTCLFVSIAASIHTAIPAFQTCLASPRADAIFKDLVVHPRPCAQLLGLCGLYYTDPAAFMTHGQRIYAANPPVMTICGCCEEQMRAQDLIGPIDQVTLDVQGKLVPAPVTTDTASINIPQIVTGQLPELLCDTKYSGAK